MSDGRRPATGGMRARERAPGQFLALGSTRAEGACLALVDACSRGAHRGERGGAGKGGAELFPSSVRVQRARTARCA